jgi:hypothetical protein
VGAAAQHPVPDLAARQEAAGRPKDALRTLRSPWLELASNISGSVADVGDAAIARPSSQLTQRSKASEHHAVFFPP